MTSIAGIFDLTLFSAFLLTYAENAVFYLYFMYVPYRIVMKGIEIAVWTLIYGAIIMLVISLLLK